VTLIVLFAVVAAWAGYAAMWLRDDRSASPARGNSIDSFRRALGSLASSSLVAPGRAESLGARPRSAGVLSAPMTPVQAARRRSQVMLTLAALAFGSLMAVSFAGLPALVVHVIADVGLLSFFYAVARRRQLMAEREIRAEQALKVVRLYPDRPAGDAATEGVPAGMRRAVGG